jgi:flagellar motility protein MotE (MotC chaperone)
LVAVAIGGVVAANALSGLQGREGLFSPREAVAEEAAQPAKPAPGDKGATQRPSPLPPPARPAPAPVCAPSAGEIAKAAGLSPAELAMLQNLQNRRGQIESRERDLDTEVQLLNAAQIKLDAKLKAMNTLKAEIQGLMGLVDQKTQAEVDRLVQVYTKMKPAEAAAVMAQLDDKVRLPLAAAMKPAVLSAILGKMGTLDAKILTERLAHRFQPVQVALETPSPPPPPEVADKDADKSKTRAIAGRRRPQRPRRRDGAPVEAARARRAADPAAGAPARSDAKAVQPPAPAETPARAPA